VTQRHRELSTATQQAIRIVAGQLGCDDEEARRRLEERSKLGQYRLHDYSRLVLDGIIRFGPDARSTVAGERSPLACVIAPREEPHGELHDAVRTGVVVG
jgi:hypothetical protein